MERQEEWASVIVATLLLMVAVLIVEVKVKDFLYSHFLSYSDRPPPTSVEQFLRRNSLPRYQRSANAGVFYQSLFPTFLGNSW